MTRSRLAHSFSTGDLFLSTRQESGDAEVKRLPGEPNKVLKRQIGRKGIVAIYQIIEGDPEPKDIFYGWQDLRWWSWPVNVLATDGFVPLKDITVLGYEPHYKPQGIAKGSGIKSKSRLRSEQCGETLSAPKVVLSTVENLARFVNRFGLSNGGSNSQALAINLMRQTRTGLRR